jgi:hypothetical protein
MTDAQMLAAVRLVHTLIYVINAGACFVVLYAGFAGLGGWMLWVSLALVGGETAVLFANRLHCPLSAIAVRYGARETGFFYDTFLPERMTRYTVHVFSAVVLLGLALIALRGLGVVT